jgi:L-malate glycosyltransferase
MVANLRILHITPHLGGGVGAVVRSYLEFESTKNCNFHKVAALDTLNLESQNLLDNIGIEWIEKAYSNKDLLASLISGSDIVLIHWWNHPLLQELLMNQELPESRIILWTHISGNDDPNSFCRFILNYPDKLVFTTPLSFITESVRQHTILKHQKPVFIWSTIGVEKLLQYKKRFKKTKQDEKIRIGYVGNLDYTKLNENFFDICRRISSPTVSFTVIGPLTDQFSSDLLVEGKDIDLIATGYIPESEKFKLMSDFDILLYPLARDHYGTCDQVIQEAMALGVVPIALNNQMESYMITNNKNGLVARDVNDLVRNAKELILNHDLRKILASNAEIQATKQYRISDMAESWNVEFKEIMAIPKRNHQTLAVEYGRILEPHEIFMNSLQTSSGIFEMHKNSEGTDQKQTWAVQISCLSGSPKWSSPTKSSPSHYFAYFPDDPWLKTWSELIRVRSSI